MGAAVLLLGLVIAGPARSGDELTLAHMRFDGIERTYSIHLPTGHHGDGRYPLLLGLYGGGGDGAKFADGTGFKRLADRYGFVPFYPYGVNDQWNDGRGATYRASGPCSPGSMMWATWRR